jgi:hypothetical protein
MKKESVMLSSKAVACLESGHHFPWNHNPLLCHPEWPWACATYEDEKVSVQ